MTRKRNPMRTPPHDASDHARDLAEALAGLARDREAMARQLQVPPDAAEALTNFWATVHNDLRRRAARRRAVDWGRRRAGWLAGHPEVAQGTVGCHRAVAIAG